MLPSPTTNDQPRCEHAVPMTEFCAECEERIFYARHKARQDPHGQGALFDWIKERVRGEGKSDAQR